MKSIIPLLLSVVLIFAGCATMAQRGAFSRANKAIKEKRYDDALAHLARAEKYAETTPELKAEIIFLRAQSYEGLGRTPDAIGAYKYIVATFPNSPYAYQAKERLNTLGKEEPNKAPQHNASATSPSTIESTVRHG